MPNTTLGLPSESRMPNVGRILRHRTDFNKDDNLMKTFTRIAAVGVAIMLFANPARAAQEKCKNASGQAVWTLIPSPNDAIGRAMGPSTGSLKGSNTAILTSLAPVPDGSLAFTSADVWVLGPQDVLTFGGQGTFTPIANQPVGTVHDSLTLTVTGGTGAYAGATGTVTVSGIGYNLFGPAAGPGNTFFDVRYEGTICTPQ